MFIYKSMEKSPNKDSSIFSGNSSRSRSRSKSHHSNTSRDKGFIIKNGCCRECMRAFSKTGKSCLCQVPKFERKYTLPDKGCHFCGCHGCNPIDVRKNKRKELKKKLKEDKGILYKRQRIIDSEDEELRTYQHDADDYNKSRQDLEILLASVLEKGKFCGYGVPMRSHSYLLGYNPNFGGPDKDRRKGGNRRRKFDSRSRSVSHDRHKH